MNAFISANGLDLFVFAITDILNSNSMTILGDIAQGVHSYRGIENWKKFIDVEFEETQEEQKVDNQPKKVSLDEL